VNPKRLIVVFVACVAALTMWPSKAAAQWHGSHVHGGASVVVGAPYYRPYFYAPFYGWGWGLGWGWGWGWGYPGWYPYYYPPYASYYGPAYSSVRLEVTPKEGEVYLDGYYVGIVDNFDGIFQRLDVPPGQHELEVYLEKYKPFRQKMLFRPGEGYKLKAVLQPLEPGETQEPRPTAAAPPPNAYPPEGQYPPARGEYPPPPGQYPPPPGGRTQPFPEHREAVPEGVNFGTLAIRVQPADAVVVIDGERWDSPEGGSRLMVQLSAGPHRVEVKKDGFRTYSTSVTIRAGETETLNISLSTGGSAMGVAMHSLY
jgi:hypothetical protein